jgi:hypothetical protein
VLGFKNHDFLKHNSLAYVDVLNGLLPMAPIPVTTLGICPTPRDSKTKCDSKDEACKAARRGADNGSKPDRGDNGGSSGGSSGKDDDGLPDAHSCKSDCKRQTQFESLQYLA